MVLLTVFLCLFLLTGCASPEPMPSTEPPKSQPSPILSQLPQPEPVPVETTLPDPVDDILEGLTIEERVGQLFLARCNEASALQDLADYHLGGLVLFSQDFSGETPDSLREKLASYQAAGRLPLLLAVDEEGGTVTRVSRYSAFRSRPFPSPRSAFADGGISQALQNEDEKCALLSGLGINVNLGPVCDISTDPQAFLYDRSLGQSPEVTADFVSRTVAIMDYYRIGSVLKHFPGYGNNGDTHTGIVVDERSLETLENKDLVPFTAGIQAGCEAILVSHTIIKALDADNPASLSPRIHAYLREVMGFEGVIVTDDLVMAAITEAYDAGEAAVLAILAGNDLLCSTEYAVQYEAVLAAVMEGRISFDMLNTAVRRVLAWKIDLGLL